MGSRPLGRLAKEGKINLFSDKEVYNAFTLLVSLVIEVINKPEFPILIKFRPK